MMIGEIARRFPWGLLVVTDATSEEGVPSWRSGEEPVTAGSTVLVLRVLHEQEGDVRVQLWDDSSQVGGAVVFTGVLEIPSGLVSVRDALGEPVLEVAVPAGRALVEIFADSIQDAADVQLVVTPP